MVMSWWWWSYCEHRFCDVTSSYVLHSSEWSMSRHWTEGTSNSNVGLSSSFLHPSPVWMLIPGKSHSRVDSRNSLVSIETLDLARVQCTVYWRDRSWIACVGARGGGAGRSPCCSWPMPGPHRSINIAGYGAPETSQNGWGLRGERDRGRAMADQPADDGPGNRRAAPPPSPLDAARVVFPRCR